jgi:hypothetical protein
MAVLDSNQTGENASQLISSGKFYECLNTARTGIIGIFDAGTFLLGIDWDKEFTKEDILKIYMAFDSLSVYIAFIPLMLDDISGMLRLIAKESVFLGDSVIAEMNDALLRTTFVYNQYMSQTLTPKFDELHKKCRKLITKALDPDHEMENTCVD